MRNVIFILAIFLSLPLVSAQFEITHPSLIFANYQSTLTQQPGTTSVYSVNVTNNGDVRLDKVYLSLSFLPSSWYEIGDSKPMEIGEIKEFTYTIKLPKDAVGSLDLDLTAHGIRGFGQVTKSSVKVKLNAGNIPIQIETAITPTITTTSIVYPEQDIFSTNATLIVILLIIFIAISLLVLLKI